ncbi:putative zinc finger, CCHC-type containing protein [Tanacetum coccineum]
MSLMIIKNSIFVSIRGAIPDSQNAKEYLISVKEQFKGTSKAHASTLILKMLTTKYDGVSGVREHIMMMRNMENKLKGMDMEISEGFLVHFIMTSLPMQFGPFKINYNTQKEKWKMSELISMYVQEEERLKVEKPDIIHVATTNSNKRKGSWKGRMTRLVKDEVLPNLDFSDFENYVECIKGKMTKGNKKGVTRSTRLLELIHTDICGPFPSGIGGHKSFITFIDDYLRYMYLFLINEKSGSFEMFKTFKAEVENQLDRKIKVVRLDRGGEYYGRHTDVGQAPGSFFDFCKDHGIINQYTMSVTPQLNGVVERRNHTLMDMVHSMKCNDPESFEDAITCDQSAHWREAMEDELNSMSKNNVWDLVELPKGVKPVGCKWVYKTKLDPNGNVKRYKARLVVKVYTQKKGADYKETFSLVSIKDSLRIVMALVAHFDLELHQMDVKTKFLNGDLHEDVYMTEPQGFKSKGQEHLVCKLKKAIYGLKQESHQWYLKFDEVMKKHNFIKNQVDQCVYLKMSGRNFIILVFYVDDILLASNNIDLLHETKCFLSRNFDMKDLGEASYVIGNEIYRDRANG